ncbi:hypothetical protein EB233_31650 [Mesorhizobium erdmanii]|uniref:Uncharacterized protein n=2 Tax=Mesorhizobium erdmanii TaxID=1777866 RepID=A0A6M7UTZ6_9HYPH|nr:hypothetical protein A8146_11150 [Mesorhizobium loti]QKC79420.1 hypothetical protein EB233_31650 [Mesorhizobium erdmanii]
MSYRDFLLDENQLLYRPIQVEGMVGRTKDGTYGIYDKNGENGRILILDRAPRDDRGAVLDKCSEGCDAVVTGRPTPIGLFATGVAVVD